MLRWIKLEQTVEVEPISHDAILMDQHQGKHPEYKTSNYWMFVNMFETENSVLSSLH